MRGKLRILLGLTVCAGFAGLFVHLAGSHIRPVIASPATATPLGGQTAPPANSGSAAAPQQQVPGTEGQGSTNSYKIIYVLPAKPTMVVKTTLQLSAFEYNTAGVITDVSAKVKWLAVEPGIVSISKSGPTLGMVKALTAGQVLITGQLGTLNGYTTITVVTALNLPPPGLTANATDGQVVLTWTAPVGSVRFDVMRSLTEGGPYTTIATVKTPTYTDTGLTDDTSYYYVVDAYYQTGGHSANSHESVGTPLAPGDFNKIQHIIYIIKENHSFDSFFGLFPGANGATQGTISTGQVVQLQRLPDPPPNDIGHDWASGALANDGGRMDRFDLINGGNVNGNLLAYSEFQQQDIPNYWTYASMFGLGDAMYSSISSGSYPGHLYMYAATSVGVVDNPKSPKGVAGWGCDASDTTTTPVITDTNPEVVEAVFPCYSQTPLAAELQNAGVSWKSYAPTLTEAGYLYSSLRSFSQVFDSPQWQTNVVDPANFVADAGSPSLASVIWLNPPGPDDEHPLNSVCAGENWTVQQINAIMAGPNWNSTAIFIAWDDFGGFFDHVPPPTTEDLYGYSIRVPFIIVSPYSKQTVYGQQGYITHTPYEFSSVLRFMEERFNVAPLTDRDATANDILDAFDFTQPPLPPIMLQQRTCP